MENEERKEEMKENEKIEVIEGTIVGNNENTSQSNKTVKPDSEVTNKKGFCIASMVLGIISIVFFCFTIISVPCAILALIFGIIGVKSNGKGMAIAGIITSAITLVLMILFFTFCFIFGFAIGINEALTDIDWDYNSNSSYNTFYETKDVDKLNIL